MKIDERIYYLPLSQEKNPSGISPVERLKEQKIYEKNERMVMVQELEFSKKIGRRQLYDYEWKIGNVYQWDGYKIKQVNLSEIVHIIDERQ